ncbi:hypothetical protein V6N13_030694 [Hibiscus sabdariffa]
MARNRVKLVYITNHATRKAIYKKRKKGLVKKVRPSAATAHRMLSDFKTMHVVEQRNMMMNQENLARQRIAKVEE